MRSTLRSGLALAAFFSAVTCFGQARPTPIDQVQMTPISASTCGAGKSCLYLNSSERLKVRKADGTVGDPQAGGGGGGGAATSFQLGAPGSPSSGDVWYDLFTGGFCGSWGGTTDCFARLGANIFTGAQKLQAAAVTVGTRSSPALTLEGQAWDGSVSQPMDVTMQSTPLSATANGWTVTAGNSTLALYDLALPQLTCGNGGAACLIKGFSGSQSAPSLIFGTNTTYSAGNDIFTWRNASFTLMRLQDDGGHKGVLLGLSSIPGLVPDAASNSGLCLKSDGTVWAGASCAAGGGGVSSVALSLPAIFSVSGSPVTSSGTLAATLAAQAQNKVWAGPTTGADAAPTFRSLVAADIPDLSGSYASLAGSYSNPSWLTTLATSKLSGQVAIASGGTGAATTSQNFAFIGPTVGSGAPSFRALVAGDVPDLSGVYQPLDSDLTALAGASSSGLWARTGAGTGAPRTIAAGTGITVTNGDGAAGNPTVALTTPVAVSSGGLGLTSAGGVTNRAVYTADGTTYIVGTLPNQALANSSVTIGSGGGVTGGSVSLGGTVTLSTTSGGDTSGSLSALVVNAIKGKAADTFTTKGDVYVYDGTAIKRLGVGTDGQVLTADSVQATGIKWATPSGGGAGTTTNALTLGTGLTGTSFNGSAPITATVDQTFSPSWSGAHTFLNASQLKINNAADTFASRLVSAATAARTATLPDATGTLAMLSLAQSWSATQTHLNAGRIRVNNSADTFYSELTSAATANRTLTLPDATDTLCGLAATQTLSAKTLTSPVISTGLTASGSGANDLSGSTGTFKTSTGAVTIGPGAVSISGNTTHAPAAVATGSPTAWTLTGAADTNQTASTEKPLFNVNGNRTVQFATGALTTQREVLFRAPTYAAVGASTITNAATVAITGAPAAGTNATITNPYALWVQAGKARLDGGISMTTAQTVVSGSNTLIGSIADKLNLVHLAIASQAIGDIIYADSSNTFTRLASVAAGSFLRSGGVGTAPVWSTTTLPNAATTGDLMHATGTNAYGNLAIGSAGRVLTSTGTLPAWGRVHDAQTTLSSGTTGAGNVDVTVLTAPAGATSNTKSFKAMLTVRLVQAMVGGGSLALTCGTSAGGTQLVLSQTITSATAVGTVYGDLPAELGASCDSTRMNNCYVDGSSAIQCRSAMTGTVSTQAIFVVSLTGQSI